MAMEPVGNAGKQGPIDVPPNVGAQMALLTKLTEPLTANEMDDSKKLMAKAQNPEEAAKTWGEELQLANIQQFMDAIA